MHRFFPDSKTLTTCDFPDCDSKRRPSFHWYAISYVSYCSYPEGC